MRWKISSRLTVVIALSAAIVVGTMVLLFYSAATLALENNAKTQMQVAVDDKATVIESFFRGENAALQSMGRCGTVQATCRGDTRTDEKERCIFSDSLECELHGYANPRLEHSRYPWHRPPHLHRTAFAAVQVGQVCAALCTSQCRCREASPKRSEWEGRCRQFAPSRSTLQAFALRII